jgi:pyrimidine operon attenuation protein/uracil phosphoribosyltransferase
LADEIVKRNGASPALAVVGIRTRGAFLAQRLLAELKSKTGLQIPIGFLDITMYRDDLRGKLAQPVLQSTEIPFNVSEKHIILVDDVLYTGRTVRCALDLLLDLGRPASIQLCVLIDRGHNELPIAADYCGESITTTASQRVQVKMKEVDGEDNVVLENEPPKS